MAIVGRHGFVLHTRRMRMMTNVNTIKNQFLDDEAFIELINRRLNELETNSIDYELERSALWSAIDYKLKNLNTMTKKSEPRDRLFQICVKHGFVPQYEVSGPPVFAVGGIAQSPDGTFTINTNFDGTYLLLTKNMLAVVRLPHKNPAVCQCSPSSNNIVIYSEKTYYIWSLSEIRLLHKESANVDSPCASWSTDENTAMLSVRRDKTAIIDLREAPCSPSMKETGDVTNFALNDDGTAALLIGDNMRLVSLPDCTLLAEHSLPHPTSDYSKIFFSEGVFNVLINGELFKVDGGLLESINLRDQIGCPMHLFDLEKSRKSLSAKIECTSHDEDEIILTIGSMRWVFTSDLLRKEYYDGEIMRASDFKECQNAFKKFIKKQTERSAYDTSKREISISPGETIYLARPGHVIGVKLISETSRSSKYAYKRYPFESVNSAFYVENAIIKAEVMEKYGPVLSPKTDVVWENAERDLVVFNHGRETYFVESSEPSPIKDDERFIQIPNEYDIWSPVLTKEGISFISFPTLGENFIEWNKPHYMHHSTHAIVLNENGIKIKEIDHLLRISSTDSTHICYYNVKSDMCSLNLKTADVETILSSSETLPVDKKYLKCVLSNGSSSLYVFQNGVESSMFLKRSLDSKIEKIDCSDLRCGGIALSKTHIIWLQKSLESIDGYATYSLNSYNISNGKQKTIDIMTMNEWHPHRMDSKGKVSLIRIKDWKKDLSSNVTLEFGKLDMTTGTLKEYVDVQHNIISPYYDLGRAFDLKNENLVERQYGSFIATKIARFQIKKEGLVESNNAIIPNTSKLKTAITVLDDEKYVIATRENDEDKSDPNSRGFRSEIRIMNSATGQKLRYNTQQSEGLMYGVPNYVIEEGSTAYPLESGRYFVAESICGGRIIVNVWDTKNGTRYPNDDAEPVYGKIVSVKNGRIKVALLDYDSIGLPVAEKTLDFDSKMRVISGSERKLDMRMIGIPETPIEGRRSKIPGLPYKDYLGSLKGKIITNIPIDTIFPGIGNEFNLPREGMVVMIPYGDIVSRTHKKPVPHLYADKSERCENIWIRTKVLFCTLTEGCLRNPIHRELEMVTQDWGEEDNEIITSCMHKIYADFIGDTYVVKQRYKENNADTPEDIGCRVLLLTPCDEKELFNVIPKYDSYNLDSVTSSDGVSLSYTCKNGNMIQHVVRQRGKEDAVFDVCNADYASPSSLYADEKLSISSDSITGKTFFTTKEKSIERSKCMGSIQLIRREADKWFFCENDREIFSLTSNLEYEQVPDENNEAIILNSKEMLYADTGVFVKTRR